MTQSELSHEHITKICRELISALRLSANTLNEVTGDLLAPEQRNIYRKCLRVSEGCFKTIKSAEELIQ